jgi:NADPH2:quinone reductase
VRAALIEEVGGLPRFAEARDHDSGEGDALIEVTAAPVNPIDLAIAAGRFYGGVPDVPYVPGMEGVGHVLEAKSVAAGTHVRFETPGGLGGPGCMAERAVAAEARLIELPENADDAVAACLGIAGLAAWLALEHRARVEEGETVLVLGASGAVGQVAVQAARLLGAGRVVAAARSAEGLERARELGADATVELAESEDPEALGQRLREAAGDPIDVTVDPLWGDVAVAAAHAAADEGRIVQLGQSGGPEARIPSALVRGKLLAILGHTTLKTPHEVVVRAYGRMLEHAAAGRLAVELEELALERVAEAWERQAGFPGRKLVLRP